MGLSIGQIANSLGAAAARAVNPPRPTVNSPTRASADEGVSLIRRETPPPPSAGFGPGTFSLQGAALSTINSTVEGARQTIPSLEEIRARFQLQAAADRDAFSESQFRDPFSLTGEVRSVESRIPEAAPQAVRFQDVVLTAPKEADAAESAPANGVVSAESGVVAPEPVTVPDTISAPEQVTEPPRREVVSAPSTVETPEPNRPEARLDVLA